MITFEQARQIVAERVAPDELFVEPHGFSDAEDWHVSVNDRSEIVAMGGPIYLVNRTTGVLHLESFVANLARYGAMKSTGGRTFRAVGPRGRV